MMKRRILALLMLFVFTSATACDPTPAMPGSPEPTPTPTAAPTLPPIPTPEPTPDPVEVLLAGLSTEEKVGQLLVAGLPDTRPGEVGATLIRDYHVGGIILFRHNIEDSGQLAGLINGLKELNGDHVPLFFCVDQEGGRVDRMPYELERTPKALTVGNAGAEAAEAYGALLAQECAAFGFNMNFAPCLDIWSNPENSVIGDRALGQDAKRVSDLSRVVLDAMLEPGNVVPVLKHFPGHGDTAADSHTDLPVVSKTREELWQSELVPFQRALSRLGPGEDPEQPLPAVMMGHILLTELDAERPSSLSPAVVDGLLREGVGYDGVVVTDDLTMGAVSNTYSLDEAVVMAVEAGCDLLLVSNELSNLETARSALLAALESGRISQERLDQSVRRILALKLEYNMTNTPQTPPDTEALNQAITALTAQVAP